MFWQSIMGSTNPADFEAYLSQFPAGAYRALATNRLATLRGSPIDPPARKQPGAAEPGTVLRDCPVNARAKSQRLAAAHPGRVDAARRFRHDHSLAAAEASPRATSKTTKLDDGGRMSTTPTTSRWLFFGPLGLVAALSLLVAAQGYLELSLDKFEATQLGRLFLIVVFAAAAIERAVEVYVNNVFGAKRTALTRDVAIAQRRVDIAEDAVTRETQRQATPGVAVDDAAVQAGRDHVSAEQQRLRETIATQHDPLTQHRSTTAAWAAALTIALSAAVAAVGVRLLGQFLHVDGSSLGDAIDNCPACPETQPDPPPDLPAETPPPTTCMEVACKRLASQIFWFRAVDMLLTTLVLAGGADGIHQIIKRVTTPTARS